MPFGAVLALVLAAATWLAASPAGAQQWRPSNCIIIADAAPGTRDLHRAAWTDPVPQRTVRLSYVAHSMFLLQTEGGFNLVTDYNGHLGPTVFRPDAVTMNRAHSSHWSDNVDGIEHVLRGWSEQFGIAADHYLDLGKILIRNVTTDIRSWGTVEEDGNSIFVFETAGLCIAHLGHLHHEPTDAQYAALGRIDVLMVPVDGGYTMDLPTMIRVVQRLRSSIVVPMHWFGPANLETFLGGMSSSFAVTRPGVSELLLSRETLPSQPTVVVLEPQPLSD